jgi:hypothetical protein
MISFYIPVFVYLTGCLNFLLINGNGIVLCHFFCSEITAIITESSMNDNFRRGYFLLSLYIFLLPLVGNC